MADMRKYPDKFTPDEDDVMTIEQWLKAKNECFKNDDGRGYYIKDGYINHEDEVFSHPPLDATHVVWYNK